MKIKKVTRIQDENSDCLEVVIDDNGEETIQCFTDAEEALKEIDGEPFFIKKIKETVPKLKASNGEPKTIKTKIDLKKFKDKEVLI